MPLPQDAVAVEPVHARVPGRVRLKVAGLRGAPRLQRRLEEALPGRGIRAVSASTRTGNVLVHFDCSLPLDDVIAAVARLARAAPGAEQAAFLAAPAAPEAAPCPGSPPFHVCEADEILAGLGSCAQRGLSSAEAAARRARFGANTLPRAEARPPLAILVEQLRTLPVAMLTASAAVSLLTGGLADALVIGGVVLLNAGIGYATESQAERTIRTLGRFAPPRAVVVRDGAPRLVDAEDVVPGDVLALSPGTGVAADARLLRARRLSTDESTLTGESMPVRKDPAPLDREEVPLGDRANMVYRGTLVTGGSGLAVAVATGRATEIGRIQRLVGEARPPETPSQAQLRRLGNQLVWGGGLVCASMFGVGALRGLGLLEMARSAVSLAVAALPEGLPTVATTTLALGVRELRRRKVLVRHIDAVETLGSLEVLCLDKTGTITRNQMRAVALFCEDRRLTVEDGKIGGAPGAGKERSALRALLETMALCNEAELERRDGELEVRGSPTERALVELARDAGLDVLALRGAWPLQSLDYRSDRRNYMKSLHAAGDGRRLVCVKGNPLEVLAMCRRVQRGEHAEPLVEADRVAVETENGRMAGEALRVLGVAFAERESAAAEDGLVWLGLVGLADPARDGIRELLALLHGAGIETAMVTGDQSATAYAVARSIELAREGQLEILDSTHMERVPPEVLSALAQRVRIFSRVSPAHKLEIVQALQRAGRVVAMTGDGVNDGPALRAADIGIAMGAGGSEIARDVADVVLEEDELGVLVDAIRQGRAIHENTRKAIHFLLSTNLSEILVMVAGIGTGLGQPLSPLQLLWLNLMTDVLPGLGLAVEPPEPDVLRHPPRDPREPLLRRSDFARIAAEAGLLGAGTLGAFAAARRLGGPPTRASTVAFMTLTVGQLLHAISCRSAQHSIFRRGLAPLNPTLKLAVGGSLAAQLATPWVPGLRRMLGLAPFGVRDALLVAAGAGLPLLVAEGLKLAGVWRGPQAAPPPTGGTS